MLSRERSATMQTRTVAIVCTERGTTSFEKAVSSTRNWLAVCMVWAAIIAWSHGREMDPDGFSYLQMAQRASEGDFAALVNALWSPGYPAMLAGLLALFRPAPETAFAVAHFLNYLLFVAAMAAFVWFLRAWSEVLPEKTRLLTPLGFIVFLKFGIDWLGVHACTPDLGVAAVLLVAAALVCRMGSGHSRRLYLPLLGGVLGLGYYIKAPVLPISLFLFLLLILFPPGPGITRRSILPAVAAFAVICAPWAVIQSRHAGHFTFGESARMNYAWYVNGVKGIHHGGPPDASTHFVHPPRRLSEHPVTLEFASPVNASYPLWYDPFYWSQGMQASFNLRQQIAAMKVTVMTYADMGLQLSVLIGVGILLLATSTGGFWPFGRHKLWIVVWPVCALALFSLVHVEQRYIAGLMIVGWVGILSLGLLCTSLVTRGALVALMGMTLLFPTSCRLMLAGGRIVSNLLRPEPAIDVLAARALRNQGLQEGDGIAVIGETFEPYYAWMGKLKVVAQVPDQDELWRLSATDFPAWLAAVERSGVKALVAMDRPRYANQVPWLDLPMGSARCSTIGGAGPHRYSIYLLREPD